MASIIRMLVRVSLAVVAVSLFIVFSKMVEGLVFPGTSVGNLGRVAIYVVSLTASVWTILLGTLVVSSFATRRSVEGIVSRSHAVISNSTFEPLEAVPIDGDLRITTLLSDSKTRKNFEDLRQELTRMGAA